MFIYYRVKKNYRFVPGYASMSFDKGSLILSKLGPVHLKTFYRIPINEITELCIAKETISFIYKGAVFQFYESGKGPILSLEKYLMS